MRLTMSFERAHVGLKNWRTLPLVVLMLATNLVLYTQFVQVAAAQEQPPQSGLVKMSFHMYRSVYTTSNSSILIYDGADTNPPTHQTPQTAVISCSIHRSAQFWFAAVDAWVGGVSWITQPLAAEMTIQGNASMTVWMSTPDPVPIASGYALGLTEADNMGNPIGNQFYQYKYDTGSVLSQSPAEYSLTFAVNRTFSKGHILAFFVILGSTARGWHYQAYFDSPNMDSFVQLPIVSLPIPEFSKLGTIACMTLVMFCFFFVRKSQRTSDV